jgi:uncharacterized protein (TIGR03067 family)
MLGIAQSFPEAPMIRRLPLVLAAVLLLAADPPKKEEDAAKKELDKLQGEWTAVSVDYNGKAHEDLAKQIHFIFKGDAASVEAGEDVRKEYAKLQFKLDPSVSPKLVDITVSAGVQKDAVIEGIYELKDDELKICGRIAGKERPTEFGAPAGSSLFVIALKRDKK